MSEPRPRHPFENGPYLAAVALCETVLREADGTFSAIRIVDTVTRTVIEDSPPPTMAPFRHDLKLLVILKAGDARGRLKLSVRTQLPSGLMGAESFSWAVFRGDDIGHAVPINMNLWLEQEGLYWFELYLDDALLTKVPLRVIYQPRQKN